MLCVYCGYDTGTEFDEHPDCLERSMAEAVTLNAQSRPMAVLVVCDQGNNRSVTIAQRIKYLGHDVLTAGIETNTPMTLAMLASWAQRIIITEEHQRAAFDWTTKRTMRKIRLWDVGPDVYKRPFNRELLKLVDALVEERRDEDLQWTEEHARI